MWKRKVKQAKKWNNIRAELKRKQPRTPAQTTAEGWRKVGHQHPRTEIAHHTAAAAAAVPQSQALLPLQQRFLPDTQHRRHLHPRLRLLERHGPLLLPFRGGYRLRPQRRLRPGGLHRHNGPRHRPGAVWAGSQRAGVIPDQLGLHPC